MTETGKNEKLKNGAQRWLRFSQLLDTCVNYGRGFCSSSHYEQKPLSYFENSFPFSQNPSRKTTGQNWQKKKRFCEFGRAVLEG
jgi:hypothetical protein